jgi:putative addiction module component (TIGR02574 family)
MNQISEIEKELLNLPPAEREKLVIRAWESLEKDRAAVSDQKIDPEGIELALRRDDDLEQGRETPLSEDEFNRLTKNRN